MVSAESVTNLAFFTKLFSRAKNGYKNRRVLEVAEKLNPRSEKLSSRALAL